MKKISFVRASPAATGTAMTSAYMAANPYAAYGYPANYYAYGMTPTAANSGAAAT